MSSSQATYVRFAKVVPVQRAIYVSKLDPTVSKDTKALAPGVYLYQTVCVPCKSVRTSQGWGTAFSPACTVASIVEMDRGVKGMLVTRVAFAKLSLEGGAA